MSDRRMNIYRMYGIYVPIHDTVCHMIHMHIRIFPPLQKSGDKRHFADSCYSRFCPQSTVHNPHIPTALTIEGSRHFSPIQDPCPTLLFRSS
jgi:hypothetical protein